MLLAFPKQQVLLRNRDVAAEVLKMDVEGDLLPALISFIKSYKVCQVGSLFLLKNSTCFSDLVMINPDDIK
ncbi:hypothetical protein DICVIV_09528 [Dictyocaulus viviparus]|uniref:Uncharacterized protein n=1 Tax=Dictyocaulus viviparus TaxID=29172 RepID=A0A0D8XKT6_DICVI|nr:hypothetical protein DICVIV_09528 [Dictyocaulus viviparus]